MGPCEIKIKENYTGLKDEDIQMMSDYLKTIKVNSQDRGELSIGIKRFAAERKWELTTGHLAKLDTLAKMNFNEDRMNDPKILKDPTMGALSIFEESNISTRGSGINVEAMQEQKNKLFVGKLDVDLKKIGFEKEFKSGKFDNAIRNAIEFGKEYTGAGADKVNAVAKLLASQYERMNREQNAAGIFVKSRKGYSGPIVHSSEKIYNKFGEWVTDISKALDLKKEFPIFSTKDIAEFVSLRDQGRIADNTLNPIVQVFRGSYDKIIRDQIDSSLIKPESMAERRAAPRSFYTWQNAEVMGEYLSKWGEHTTLAEQYNYYARSAARDIGLASVLGPDHTKGFKAIQENLKTKLEASGMSAGNISEELKKVRVAYESVSKREKYDPNFFGKMLILQRQVAASAWLGKSGLTSMFLDPASAANQRRIMLGEGYWSSQFKSRAEWLTSLSEGAFNKLAADQYLIAQHQLSTSLEEMRDLSFGKRNFKGVAEFVSKISGGSFFNRVAHISAMKQALRMIDGHVMGSNPILDASLGRFGITQKELDLVKNFNIKEYGMLNIHKVTPEHFMSLVSEGTFRNTKEAEVALTNFQEKIGLWSLEQAKKGAPLPGNRERRIMYGDTKAGTGAGELRRYVGQFKVTAYKTMLDSTVGALRTMNPNADQTGIQFYNRQSVYYIGRLALSSAIAGGQLMYWQALSSKNEKQMKRFAEADPFLVVDFALRGGLGFITNDLLSLNPDAKTDLAQVVSPAIAAIIGHFASAGTALHGKPLKALETELKNNLPAGNHWLVRPLLEGINDESAARKSSGSGKNPLD